MTLTNIKNLVDDGRESEPQHLLVIDDRELLNSVELDLSLVTVLDRLPRLSLWSSSVQCVVLCHSLPWPRFEPTEKVQRIGMHGLSHLPPRRYFPRESWSNFFCVCGQEFAVTFHF